MERGQMMKEQSRAKLRHNLISEPREPEWVPEEHIDMEGCPHCDGDGVSGHDCGEDTCCCAYPEDNKTCYMCHGTGWV